MLISLNTCGLYFCISTFHFETHISVILMCSVSSITFKGKGCSVFIFGLLQCQEPCFAHKYLVHSCQIGLKWTRDRKLEWRISERYKQKTINKWQSRIAKHCRATQNVVYSNKWTNKQCLKICFKNEDSFKRMTVF